MEGGNDYNLNLVTIEMHAKERLKYSFLPLQIEPNTAKVKSEPKLTLQTIMQCEKDHIQSNRFIGPPSQRQRN